MTEKTMMLPALSREATIRAESFDEAQRTVEVMWTSGARVRRRRFFDDDFDEELEVSPRAIRTDRLNSGAPFLNAHNAFKLDAVLGVVVGGSIRIENGQAFARIRFSDREDVQPIVKDIRDGIIRNVSVGYRVHKYEIEKRDGMPELWRAVDWEPLEISAVPIGADPAAGFRSDQGAARQFECSIVRQTETAPATPAQIERKGIMPDEKKPAGGVETVDERKLETEALSRAKAEGAQQERERLAAIEDLKKRHLLGEDWAKRMRENPALTVQDIRNAALDELAKRDNATGGVTEVSDAGIRMGRSAEDKFLEGAANAIIVRAGQEQIVRRAMGDSAKPLDPGQFRGHRLVDLAREFVEFRGNKTTGLGPDAIVRTALMSASEARSVAHGANTTGDFGTLLENVMHKILLGSYAVTPDTWSRFCKTGSVTDFRPHPRYRLGSFGSLDTVPQSAEFKQKQIPDGEKYTIQAATKGNIIALTRQAIINDDLSAFSDMATMFGRAAKLSIESDVYALLALNSGLGPTLSDSNTLFHATHGNIAATGAISVAVLDDARVKMKSQKDISGNELLDLIPAVLVVPAGSGGAARVLIGAEYDPDANNKLQRPNIVRGLVRDIVDTSRLSGTRGYVFADPAVSPVIEVAFLNGQMEPFLDSQEGWRVDGIEWKVRIDYGVAAQDFRGAVTFAGA